MTATELYEIVKDHRDVWGVTLHFDDYGFWVDSFSHPETLRDDTAESALLGLGVRWLLDHTGEASLFEKSTGYDVTSGDSSADSRSMLAAVYAAIDGAKHDTGQG